jgi:Protein of unknown function DUF262
MSDFQPTLLPRDDAALIAAIDVHRRDVATVDQFFPCETVAKKLDDEEIHIPDYQRPFVWTPTMQSRFIESLLLGLPIPYVFYSKMKDGRLEVVDGSQRLRTVHAFLKDKLRLQSLEKLPALNGLYFSDLPTSEQLNLKHLMVKGFAFSAHTDETTRYDVFRRINSYGKVLTDAQNRAGSLKGSFYDLVLRCAKHPQFIPLCAMSNSKDSNGDRAERVLRFFCYAERYTDFRHDVRNFLDAFVREKNGDPRTDLKAYQKRFEDMLQYVADFFPYGFYRSKTSTEVPRVRFEAISVGVHLALESGKLNPIPSFEWLDSDEFKQHCRTDASNSAARLRGRVEYVRDRLVY